LWCQCAKGFECQSAPVSCLWNGYAQGFGVSHIDRTSWLRNASGLDIYIETINKVMVIFTPIL
jgi:hypothetical protein